MSWHDTHFKGAAQEATFDKVCCERAWLSANPFLDSLQFDRLVSFDKGRTWQRVQIKASNTRNRKDGRANSEVIDIRRHNNIKYTLDDFEFLFSSVGEKHWLIPWTKEIADRGEISLTSQVFDKHILP